MCVISTVKVCYISVILVEELLHFKDSWALVFYYYYYYYFRVTEEAAIEGEKNLGDDKPVEEAAADRKKENPANEPEEKEPEDKVNALCSN